MRTPRRTFRTSRDDARPRLQMGCRRSSHATEWGTPVAAILMPGLVLWMASPGVTLPLFVIALICAGAFVLVVEVVDRVARNR